MTRGHSDDKHSTPKNTDDPALEALQDLLLSKYRQRIAELEAELSILEKRLSNKDALVATVTPVISDAIRRKIRDARDEMVEALYPIIGQTVVRAVSEAIRDLRRDVDSRMRLTFRPAALARRVQATASGISTGELTLREALPFQVTDLFLIHLETGLLLWHNSTNPNHSPDTDLISGMLTAIRDFVAESFGRDKTGQLDEIQYGDQRILIEAARYSYLAVVVDGIEPPGFRAIIRERIIEIDLANENIWRKYRGEATTLVSVEEPLRSLFDSTEPAPLSRRQKWALLVGALLLLLCSVGSCFSGRWVWLALNNRSTPVVIIMPARVPPTLTATPTFTVTPTPTATFTPTPTVTLTPSPTATFTPIPSPTPVTGVMIGNVWLRQEPSFDALRLGLILPEGRPVEILAATGDWYLVKWTPEDQAEVMGWAPGRWVGTVLPIPETIITPTGAR
ncbi:MAG: hypothetical protein FOGNACKC_04986 [Anaerolineae bacterium]|nr:hypothetical protein [Anaerolineae bacterium]